MTIIPGCIKRASTTQYHLGIRWKWSNAHEHRQSHSSECISRQYSPSEYYNHRAPQAEPSKPRGPILEIDPRRKNLIFSGDTAAHTTIWIEPKARSYANRRSRPDGIDIRSVCVGGGERCIDRIEIANGGHSWTMWGISISTGLNRTACKD